LIEFLVGITLKIQVKGVLFSGHHVYTVKCHIYFSGVFIFLVDKKKQKKQ